MDKPFLDDVTDEELAKMGIEIPESETDESFFENINKMIEEVFQEE